LAEFPLNEISKEQWALFFRVEHFKKNVFFGRPENEEEGTTIVRNICIFLPGDTVSRLESSH
jgi:hypothetical protein